MTTPPTMLFQGACTERDELQRRMRALQDKRSSLLVHRSADQSAERLPEYADELDTLPPPIANSERARRKDSWVGKCIIILTLTCAAMAALKFAVEKFNLY